MDVKTRWTLIRAFAIARFSRATRIGTLMRRSIKARLSQMLKLGGLWRSRKTSETTIAAAEPPRSRLQLLSILDSRLIVDYETLTYG
jgi:hypothetical protein